MSSPSEKPAPALITFGRGGHTVYYFPQSRPGSVSRQRMSGYSTPENFFLERPSHRPDGPMARDHEIAEFHDCPVIDMRKAAGTPAGIHMAISGPMVQPGMGEDEVVKCPRPSGMLVAGLAESTYGGLVAINETQRATGARAGALDYVSIPEYIQLWRQAGANIGVARNGKIEFALPKQEVQAPKGEQSEMLLDAGCLKAPVIEESKTPAAASPSIGL